jgi:hypothetical protein
VKREEHVLNETFQHGIASHGGIYDSFCAHHASRGVD